MKFFILTFLSCLTALGQAVPPSYPYPVPLPASGSTPPFKVLVTQVVQPSDYSDPRPVLWDVWVGGGYRSVATTVERDAILAQRRKEGMLVFVAANAHVYRLSSNLTSWVDLGDPATWSGASTTIYTGDGTLSGNRIVGGGGFSLDFSANSTVNFSPGTSFTASGANVFLNGVTATKINNTGPSPFLFLATPPAAASTHELLARDPATGNISFSPSYTIGTVSTPATIYSANGTLASDRTVSGGTTRSLSFSALNSFVVGASVFGIGSTTAAVLSSGSTAITMSPTAMRFATPSVIATTAQVGDVPTLSNATTGEFDWASPVNIYSANGTLSGNRTVSGGGVRSLSLTGMTTLGLGASTAIVAASGNNSIAITPTTVELVTPAVFGSTATVGQVPILANATTGAFEWGTAPNFYNSNGTMNGLRTVNGNNNQMFITNFLGITLQTPLVTGVINLLAQTVRSDTPFFIIGTNGSPSQVTFAPNSAVPSSAGFEIMARNPANGVVTWSPTRTVDGDIQMDTAKKLTVKTGTNQRAGDVALSGGTIAVSNTTVTTNTRVIYARRIIGGTAGNLSYTVSNGVGFTINSDSGTDTSTVSYFLIEVN